MDMKKPTIYMASKAKHGARWRDLRAKGHRIISTWIDEAEPGKTKDFSDLWHRCVHEAFIADNLIAYIEPGETLKGALVEIGVALGANANVILVGDFQGHSFIHHPGIVFAATIEDALAIVDRRSNR